MGSFAVKFASSVLIAFVLLGGVALAVSNGYTNQPYQETLVNTYCLKGHPEEQGRVETIVNEDYGWGRAGYHIELSPSCSGANLIIGWDFAGPQYAGAWLTGPTQFYIGIRYDAWVTMSDKLRHGVLNHEIGHGLGLGHTATGLMSSPGWGVPSVAEINEVVAAHGTASKFKGDVDCDGRIGAVDALKVLEYSVGLRPGSERYCTEFWLAAADMTSDGVVDSLDALAIINAN